MIKIELLSQKNFNVNSLDSFIRMQEVKRVFRKNYDDYTLVDFPYIEDWDLREKRRIASSISNCEHISYIALDDTNVVGFISLIKKPYGKYLLLDYMHVSADYRGKGIGKKLFNLVKIEAKTVGAEALYISACSSEETVAFYRAMGAELTQNPIKEFAEKEPCDLQMVYKINN